MDRIGNQRETAREQSSDDLHNRQHQIDHDSPDEPGVTGFGVDMVMMSAQSVILRLSEVSGGGAEGRGAQPQAYGLAA